jgi:hypothetical protein
MNNQRKNHSILKVILITLALMFIVSGCERTSTTPIVAEAQGSDLNGSSKYLDAFREFADNVLKYGRDTYGPLQTPLCEATSYTVG